MATITHKNAAQQPFMPLMRELVRAYQAFTQLDAEGHRVSGSGLTVPQADVVFTLGNTDGMTCSEVGEKTLITKGTLTGVIDRLVAKGLVARKADPEDGRRTRLVLTPAGDAVFEQEFPRQISMLARRFNRMNAAERESAVAALRRLREVLEG